GGGPPLGGGAGDWKAGRGGFSRRAPARAPARRSPLRGEPRRGGGAGGGTREGAACCAPTQVSRRLPPRTLFGWDSGLRDAPGNLGLPFAGVLERSPLRISAFGRSS